MSESGGVTGVAALEVGLAVAVVDEQPVVREGIFQLLGNAPGVRTVRAYADVPISDDIERYEVMVLGIHSRNGLPLLHQIHRLVGHCRLMVLCDSVLLVTALVLLDAGVDGYLTTDTSEAELHEAVRRVAKGHSYLAASVVDAVRQMTAGAEKWPRLAPREAQVVHMVAAGFTHVQTARRMGVSVATVETYLKRIRNKFQVDTPSHLARLARQAYLRMLLDEAG